MTQQSQAQWVISLALLKSFNNPTSYAENYLLLATARTRLNLIEGIWGVICKTNDIGLFLKVN
jgi:hypothetical protein